MDDGSDFDYVLISVRCLVSGDAETKVEPDLFVGGQRFPEAGIRSFDLGTTRVEEDDAAHRQSAFAIGLRAYRSSLRTMNIDKDWLRERGGRVEIAISLVARSGQAGIVLTTELLSDWEDIPVDFFVDTL